AWIPGRNDILMTIFLLLSFLFFCRVIETNKFRFNHIIVNDLIIGIYPRGFSGIIIIIYL
ncbi:MAG: hypothetical protein KKF93_03695, partial [Candidatus Omnitrophica bacterium]|nr:hypothetical protein [Candidatus Omnitrophota bacterium]